jgi:hypothetical protein
MNNTERAERIREIRDQICELLTEAHVLAEDSLGHQRMGGFDAYVFEQINEHLEKGNPYNQDLEDVADAVESEGEEDSDEDSDEDED